jgi:hypothetical protein
MSKYRLKPIAVEAWRNDDIGEHAPEWVDRYTARMTGGIRVMQTPDGQQAAAELGDWIVMRDGYVFPCRDEVFTTTYERVQ